MKGKYLETWKALEHLVHNGRVRAIGVCNFQVHHLEDLMGNCEIIPAVNQVEFHPRLTQKELLAFCNQNQIRMEAWAPLMRGKILDHETIVTIAEKHEEKTGTGYSPLGPATRSDHHSQIGPERADPKQCRNCA